MTVLALPAVQQAIYNKLIGDGVLMGMISGIYDAIPQDAGFPYVLIGEASYEGQPQLVSQIVHVTTDIHVWGNDPGRKRVLSVLNRLYGMLHRAALNVSGFTVLACECREAHTTRDTLHGRVEGVLRVVITATEEAG